MCLQSLSSVDNGQHGRWLNDPLCIMEHLHCCSALDPNEQKQPVWLASDSDKEHQGTSDRIRTWLWRCIRQCLATENAQTSSFLKTSPGFPEKAHALCQNLRPSCLFHLKVGQVYSRNSIYRVPWRYHDIREGGIWKSGKNIASGLRTDVQNQKFGMR
jgi:hypothetical protein